MPADPKPAKRVKDPAALKQFRMDNLGEPCDICQRRAGVDPHHIQFRSGGGGDVPENLLWLRSAVHAMTTSTLAVPAVT